MVLLRLILQEPCRSYVLRDVICSFCSACCDLDLCRDTSLQVLCWLAMQNCKNCPCRTQHTTVAVETVSADCVTCWPSASGWSSCLEWKSLRVPAQYGQVREIQTLLSRGSCEKLRADLQMTPAVVDSVYICIDVRRPFDDWHACRRMSGLARSATTSETRTPLKPSSWPWWAGGTRRTSCRTCGAPSADRWAPFPLRQS